MRSTLAALFGAWLWASPAQATEPYELVTPSASATSSAGFVRRAPTCALEQTELIARERPLDLADIRLKWPMESRLVTSDFGKRKDPVTGVFRKSHRGVDVRCPNGTPVFSAADGIVTYAKQHGRGGLTIKIDHGGELSTRYAHLSRSLVKPGDRIRAGQRIALSGASGRVTGPHLHFEIWVGKKPKNPLSAVWQLPEDPFLGPATTDTTLSRRMSSLKF